MLTTRELSLNRLQVLGRLREIALSGAAACVAVLLVRHMLTRGGIETEPRLAISIVAGTVTYVGCLTLLAPSVARELFRMLGGLGAALRPKS